MSPKSGAEAELTLRYRDKETAKSVEDAVSPDNFQAPEGIELDVKRVKSEINIRVRCSKGVGSLLTTLDDLLSCLGAAEKALNGID